MDEHKKYPPMTRRTLVRGAAWTAPTVVAAVAAPAMAASLRKDPGLNGWVWSSHSTGSCGSASTRIEVSSARTGKTPDGAPFGLYLYDSDDVEHVTGATITYWVLGSHATTGSTAIRWTSGADHSSCWTPRGRIGTTTKPDGLTYTGYRWTYSCAIDPAVKTVGADGVERIVLNNFHVPTNYFEQPAGSCGKMNFWAERAVVIDGSLHTFQRRAGSDGAYTSSSSRSRRSLPEGDAEQTL